MIHYQYHNSKLLFIGINPHEGSYRRAVPFSNNKMFWYLLNQAGLIKEKVEDLRNDEKLLRSMKPNSTNFISLDWLMWWIAPPLMRRC
jgi:TDG/mug DNA glycosylase family protein